MAQTVGVTTTYYALDVAIGLPEVLYTSEDNAYLHLPGVIVTENTTGDVRYLLSDGLGSVRHAVDETATVITYKDFDPYGSPLPTAYSLLPTPYGYTGEWWEADVGLLYLRARWYQPETGTFLSRDTWSGSAFRPDTLQGYIYAGANPVRYIDPSGKDYIPEIDRYTCDDSHASGGYVVHFSVQFHRRDAWACIVNPNNVQYNGALTVIAEGDPGYPPDWSRGWPPRWAAPIPVPDLLVECDIPFDEPLRIPIITPNNVPAEIIFFPPGHPPTRPKDLVWARTLSQIGVGLDVAEVVATPIAAFFPPAAPLNNVIGYFDLGVTAWGDYLSGEMVFGEKLHPSLPPMVTVGQDTMLALADNMVADGAQVALPAIGISYGGAYGAIVGHVSAEGVDVLLSAFEGWYGYKKLKGDWRTMTTLALFWDSGPRIAILVHPK